MDVDDPDWIDELLGRFLVDVKLKGSDKWQPMPIYYLDGDMTKPFPDWANSALQDVTQIRILFPVSR